eukprot:814294-Pleurochrysis_carterae.AAC.1
MATDSIAVQLFSACENLWSFCSNDSTGKCGRIRCVQEERTKPFAVLAHMAASGASMNAGSHKDDDADVLTKTTTQ